VLRALATVSDAKDLVPVARPAALESFAVGSQRASSSTRSRQHDCSLRQAKARRADRAARHEALVGRWQRAREQLAIDRRDLATRMLIEQQLRRYNEIAPCHPASAPTAQSRSRQRY